MGMYEGRLGKGYVNTVSSCLIGTWPGGMVDLSRTIESTKIFFVVVLRHSNI